MIVLYLLILFGLAMIPPHLGGLNKKSTYNMARIKIACWAFGWTGIGYVYALYLAFVPEPRV